MDSKRGGEATFACGIACSAVFGYLFLVSGAWWAVFPLVFAGILPTVDGMITVYRDRVISGKSKDSAGIETEKQVLRVAQRESGKLTPAIVALNSDLSIDDAEKVLSNFVTRGYASMNVQNDGRIVYEFLEFLRPPRVRLRESVVRA